jgi:hypothetical protein
VKSLLLSLLLLSGCSPYWVKTEPAMLVIAVQYVDDIPVRCGRKDAWGCIVKSDYSAVIYIDRNLPEPDKACTLEHELHHAQGYDHDHNWHQYKLDCGNT